MKTKKVITGTVAAAMLSLSVCAVSPIAYAAGETVQISASNEEAKAGENFTVEVSFTDVPSTGFQSTDFAIEYDASVLTIDAANVKAGAITETGAEGADPSAAMLELFSVKSPKSGTLNIEWSTQADSTYWIKNSGVFCTITGTVADSAAAGTVSEIKIVPVDRETYPDSGVQNTEIECGYMNADGTSNSYGVTVSNGSVTVITDVVTTTTTAPPVTTTTTQPDPTTSVEPSLRGDANDDGKVDVADPVLIMQSLANPDVYGLNKKDGMNDRGAANADVVGNDGVTGSDALKIQQYLAGLVDTL